MSTLVLKPWLDDEIKIVQEIVSNYQGEGGKIRWKQAFIANPGWQKKLLTNRSRGAVLAKGNELRNKLKLRAQPRTARLRTWTEEQIKVIQRIVEAYGIGKGEAVSVDYKAAFAAHPEWRALLVGKGNNAIYSMGRKLQIKHNKRTMAEASRNGHPIVAPGALAGKFFVLTGTFATGRRTALARRIEEAGGTMRPSVNRNVHYLVSGIGSGQSKLNAAQRAKVSVITEEQLYQLMGKPMPTIQDNSGVDTDVALPDQSQFAVNGCPNCMFNLKIMNEEYAKHGIEPPPFCPNCTFPVNIVRTAVRLANKHQGAAV